MTTEIEQPQTRAFICPHCEKPALARIMGRAINNTYKELSNNIVQIPSEYILEQCETCDDVCLTVREDFGDTFSDFIVLYPAARKLSPQIPADLRREYDEAIRCFSAKAYTATVVMVRRILEGTCKENGIEERVLIRSLEKLKDAGLVNETLAEWMDALRVVGNEGAHFTGNSVKRVDAQDSLAFIEALLDHIYVLRKRFQEFKDRRASK